MPRIRKEIHRDFTVVLNAFVRDKNLGINARGILITMLSMPEYTNDGKQRVQTALNELEKCGYLMRRQITDEKGRFVDLEYIFSDEVMPEAIEAYQEKMKAKSGNNGNNDSGESDDFFASPNPEKTSPKKSDTRNPNPENPYPEKSDNNKINKYQISKNQTLSDEVSINQSSPQAERNPKKTESSATEKEMNDSSVFSRIRNTESSWILS